MNKRVPRELQRYVVHIAVKDKSGTTDAFKYFTSQREAKGWAYGQVGRKRLFRIDYDYYGDLK